MLWANLKGPHTPGFGKLIILQIHGLGSVIWRVSAALAVSWVCSEGSRGNSGKITGELRKFFESRDGLDSRIWGTGKKANLQRTLGRHWAGTCPQLLNRQLQPSRAFLILGIQPPNPSKYPSTGAGRIIEGGHIKFLLRGWFEICTHTPLLPQKCLPAKMGGRDL